MGKSGSAVFLNEIVCKGHVRTQVRMSENLIEIYMNNILESLIERGKEFNFENNSYHSGSDVFSRASDEFLAWVANVEDFVSQNYEDESGPMRLFKTINRNEFSGYYQSSFEKQLTILRGVLLSCKTIQPSKLKRKKDNSVRTLTSSIEFWAVILVLVGGAFTLGLYFGNNKFDKDLIELTQIKKDLQDSIKIKENLIKTLRHNSDSALSIISHMPYNEMHLDTLEFRKVQTNIENAGAVLYLNK